MSAKLAEATQKLLDALQPTHHRRIEPMAKVRRLELSDNVNEATTAGMVTDAASQLNAQLDEYDANIATLREEIERLEDLKDSTEKARDALVELEGCYN